MSSIKNMNHDKILQMNNDFENQGGYPEEFERDTDDAAIDYAVALCKVDGIRRRILLNRLQQLDDT